MKGVYALHGRLLMMLVLSVLIFMATVPMGNCFYNRKKTQLKAIDVKRGTSKWIRASDNGGNPENQSPSDNTKVKRVRITNANGYSITRGLKRKRNITLSGSGSSRSKRAKGKVKSFPIIYSKY